MDQHLMDELDQRVMRTLTLPSLGYIAVIAAGLLLVAAGVSVFFYQWVIGMGVTGESIPAAWSFYIAHYVFWIAVAMSGTFISAMLYMFRTSWRSVINRIAETMTLFAIIIAGIFPLIHVGRNWVVFWSLPYPNWRHLWPNFQSPLVWDAMVISVYLIVSVIFLYLGMIPDLATIRDRLRPGWKRQFYAFFAMGWSGKYDQWRQYARSYLALVTVAMPLAMGVHSVTSWDFSMGIIPGWHSTFYAPYFIAGAILSGLATIITLLVPIRKLFHLESIFKASYMTQMACLMIMMAWILGYNYVAEGFMDWYSTSKPTNQFNVWRASGSPYYTTIYWVTLVLVVALPMTYFFRSLRTNLKYLLITSILINAGMFLERFMLVVTPLTHGYLPSSWGIYAPRVPEILLTGLAIGLFLSGVLIFIRIFPLIALSEVKKSVLEKQGEA